MDRGMKERQMLAIVKEPGNEPRVEPLFENSLHAPNGCRWGAIADHLIANGVTVQKWIPVTERLPEESGSYIVAACDEGCSCGEGIWYDTVVVVAEYYEGGWTWNENGTEYDLSGLVTHWMHLPEPPKGE